jgi:hypothetical protein
MRNLNLEIGFLSFTARNRQFICLYTIFHVNCTKKKVATDRLAVQMTSKVLALLNSFPPQYWMDYIGGHILYNQLESLIRTSHVSAVPRPQTPQHK